MKIEQYYSGNYLARARGLLDKGNEASLFYAAYELRAGIEARLLEYSRAEERRSKMKQQQWRIGKIAKGLKRASVVKDKIVEVKISRGDGSALMTVHYTPVTKELRKMGERLGELLHGSKPTRLFKDGGIDEEREFLESVYTKLDIATRGVLLAPPLLIRGTPNAEFIFDATDETRTLRSQLYPSLSPSMEVAYYDSWPQIP